MAILGNDGSLTSSLPIGSLQAGDTHPLVKVTVTLQDVETGKPMGKVVLPLTHGLNVTADEGGPQFGDVYVGDPYSVKSYLPEAVVFTAKKPEICSDGHYMQWFTNVEGHKSAQEVAHEVLAFGLDANPALLEHVTKVLEKYLP